MARRQRRKTPRVSCKDTKCNRKFKPLNVRHAYCSHRCKNRAAARRRHSRERLARLKRKRVSHG